jgi:class 3 adenylate cyclase
MRFLLLSRFAAYRAISVTARISRLVLLGIAAFFVLTFAFSFLDGARENRVLGGAIRVEERIESEIRRAIPTKVGGRDVTRWIVVVASLFAAGIAAGSAARFRYRADVLRVKVDYERLRSKAKLAESSAIFSPLQEALQGGNQTSREDLLRVFAETKRKLDQIGRDLAFLSIDVVDSTGMKAGEERAAIEHDFREYKRMVDAKLRSEGCLKSTWTPDGVMSCFDNIGAAVRAAGAVIAGLDSFNREVKSMRRDFSVRCGVNAGFVYFDDSIPLEEMSDHVIDVAGHMQKHAEPNTVCVAKPAIQPVDPGTRFEPAGRVVDGYEVYAWRPVTL